MSQRFEQCRAPVDFLCLSEARNAASSGFHCIRPPTGTTPRWFFHKKRAPPINSNQRLLAPLQWIYGSIHTIYIKTHTHMLILLWICYLKCITTAWLASCWAVGSASFYRIRQKACPSRYLGNSTSSGGICQVASDTFIKAVCHCKWLTMIMRGWKVAEHLWIWSCNGQRCRELKKTLCSASRAYLPRSLEKHV